MIAALALAAATAAAPPVDIAPNSYAVNATSVLVRRTPSLPGPVIEEVKGDTLFKVVSCSGGWCQLDLGRRAGGFGYLPQGELIPVQSPAPFSP